MGAGLFDFCVSPRVPWVVRLMETVKQAKQVAKQKPQLNASPPHQPRAHHDLPRSTADFASPAGIARAGERLSVLEQKLGRHLDRYTAQYGAVSVSRWA